MSRASQRRILAEAINQALKCSCLLQA